MSTHEPPIAEQCPSCGRGEHTPARARSVFALSPDRVCVQCQTRYRRPTPGWAKGLAGLTGLVLVGIGVVGVIVAVVRSVGEPGFDFSLLAFMVVVAMIGGWLCRGAWLAWHERVLTAPDQAEPAKQTAGSGTRTHSGR